METRPTAKTRVGPFTITPIRRDNPRTQGPTLVGGVWVSHERRIEPGTICGPDVFMPQLGTARSTTKFIKGRSDTCHFSLKSSTDSRPDPSTVVAHGWNTVREIHVLP